MLPGSMDNLLAKLSEQQALLEKQKNSLAPVNKEETHQPREDSSSSSILMTPGSDKSSDHSQKDNRKSHDDTIQLGATEMNRLKKELDAAKNQIARQKQELDQTRVIKHTLAQAMTSSPSPDHDTKQDTSGSHQGNFNAVNRPVGVRQDAWSHNEDARSEFSDSISAGVFNTGQNIWTASTRPAFNAGVLAVANQQFQPPASTWGQPGARPWNHRAIGTPLPQLMVPPQQMQQRTYSGPASPASSNDGGLMSDYNQFPASVGNRRSVAQTGRNASMYPQRSNGWDVYAGGIQPVNGHNLALDPSATFQSVGLYPSTIQYQPRPIGTPLSPTAEEFRATQPSGTPWNAAASISFIQNIIIANVVCTASIVPRADLCLTNGASKLSTFVGSKRNLQLEIYC